MNYQRFGWHEDRSNMDREDFEPGRYPRRDYGRYGGSDGRGDGHRGVRGFEPYASGDYQDTDFYRERDEMGRFTGRPWNDDRYDRGYRSGRQYDLGPDRDEMGRFTSEGYGRRDHGMRGPHTGRGPKNYQRSEERVKEDVSDQLERDGFLDASEIEVKVKEGIVSLTGTVESREEKRRAEEIAERCSGVKDVQNQLRVTASGRNASQHQSGTQSGQQQQDHNRKSA